MSSFLPTITCALAATLLFAGAVHPSGQRGADCADTSVEDRLDPQIREILAYAARASSSHNAQPWKIEAAGTHSLELSADRSRYLPAVDPTNREMFLSFGAFLETLDQAAKALGYRAAITVLTESTGDTRIATIDLEAKAQRRDEATLNLLTSLYTPKGALGTEPLEAAEIQLLGADRDSTLRYLPRDSDAFRWIAEQTPKASLQQAWRDPVQEELAGFMHFSRRTARETGYGLTPEMMEMAPLGRLFWYTFMSRKSTMSKPFRNGIEGITAKQLARCAGAIIITSADRSPSALIEAGRRYQHLKIAAFRLGLGVHPLSSLLEEEPWQHQIESRLGSDRAIQFILRTGRLQRPIPDFQADALTSASIRMKPEQFVTLP